MGVGDKRPREMADEELADVVGANISDSVVAARMGHERVRTLVLEVAGLIEATSPGENDNTPKQGGASILISGRAPSGREGVVREALAMAREKMEDVEVLDVWLDGIIHKEDPTRALARRLLVDTEGEVVPSVRPMTVPQAMSRIQRRLESPPSDSQARPKLYIFVLSHFELFIAKCGVDQSFLYSLLDIIQGDRVSGMVIGLTERVDAEEFLEKRIKSRFSHRVRLMPPPVDDKAKLKPLIASWLKLKGSINKPGGVKAYNSGVSDFLGRPDVVRNLVFAWQRDPTLSKLETALQGALPHLCAVPEVAQKQRKRQVDNASSTFAHFIEASNGISTRQELLERVSRSEIIIMGTLSKLHGLRKEKAHTLQNVLHYFNGQRTHGGILGPTESLALKSLDQLLALELVAFADGGTTLAAGGMAVPKAHRPLILSFKESELINAILKRKDLSTEDERLMTGHWDE